MTRSTTVHADSLLHSDTVVIVSVTVNPPHITPNEYSTGQQMATRVREHIHNNVHMLSMHTVSASPSRGDKADGSAHSDDHLYGDDDTPVVAIRFTY
jgi:hypothetical protein